MYFRRLLLGFVIALALHACQAQAVDFEREVRPILISRCVRCHGPDKQEGGLRLDDRAQAILGGQSGTPLIETPVEENELWRRITSPEVEVRMPLDGPPLTETELSRLRSWVNTGAPWPTIEATQKVTQGSSLLRLDRWFKAWEPLLVRARPTLLFGAAVLVLLAILSRTSTRLRAWITPASYLLVVLIGVLNLARLQAQLHREREAAYEKAIADLQREVAAAHEQYRPSGKLVRPLHPPALRRTYYRGNDERSDKLYNGGFYRTATIDLALIDAAGNQLQAPGDMCAAGALSLRVEIHRAKQAATALFTNDIARRVYLSPQAEGNAITNRAAQVFPLEIIADGDFWRATVPLGEIKAQGAQRIATRWYVIHGESVQGDNIVGPAHYGIDVTLVLNDGRVQPGSDLWMASLLSAANMVATPPGRLHALEWFDFRPIPEIEGENTSDPKLIGVPEHGR